MKRPSLHARSFLEAKAASYLIGKGYGIHDVGYLNQMFDSYPLKSRLDGMTVVDVGCELSSFYWRANGAKKVIGYEVHPRYVRMIKAQLDAPWYGGKFDGVEHEKWFEFRGAWNGEYPEGDVFKIDAETAERILDPSKLANYKFWFVALHDRPFNAPDVSTLNLRPALEKMGAELVLTWPPSGRTIEYAYRGGALG